MSAHPTLDDLKVLIASIPSDERPAKVMRMAHERAVASKAPVIAAAPLTRLYTLTCMLIDPELYHEEPALAEFWQTEATILDEEINRLGL